MHAYIVTHTHTHTHTNTHTHTHTNTHTHEHTHTHTHTYVSGNTSMTSVTLLQGEHQHVLASGQESPISEHPCVCMYVCMYVCHRQTNKRTNTNTQTFKTCVGCVHRCVCVCVCVCILRVCTHTFKTCVLLFLIQPAGHLNRFSKARSHSQMPSPGLLARIFWPTYTHSSDW